MSLLKFSLSTLFLLFTINLVAQVTFPKNGVYDERDNHYAFTNATIYISPEKKIEKAVLIIREGKVVQVGKAIQIPSDAVVVDLAGKYIYPSFIELSSNYGLPKATAFKKKGNQLQRTSNKPGAYSWNEALRPEIAAHTFFTVNNCIDA